MPKKRFAHGDRVAFTRTLIPGDPPVIGIVLDPENWRQKVEIVVDHPGTAGVLARLIETHSRYLILLTPDGSASTEPLPLF